MVGPRWEKDSGNFPDFFKAENDRTGVASATAEKEERESPIEIASIPNQPTNRPLIYFHLVGEAGRGRDQRVPSERESGGGGELHSRAPIGTIAS